MPRSSLSKPHLPPIRPLRFQTNGHADLRHPLLRKMVNLGNSASLANLFRLIRAFRGPSFPTPPARIRTTTNPPISPPPTPRFHHHRPPDFTTTDPPISPPRHPPIFPPDTPRFSPPTPPIFPPQRPGFPPHHPPIFPHFPPAQPRANPRQPRAEVCRTPSVCALPLTFRRR